MGKEETYTVEPDKRKPQYGRLEADDRSSEMRVVHQYPKQGKFRFPVIEDETKTTTKENHQFNTKKITERKVEKKESQQPQVKTRVVSTYNGSREEYKSSSENKRELFSNSNFKPTYIPSPIYGFKKREEKKDNPVNEKIDVGHVPKKDSLPKSSEINVWLNSKEDNYADMEREVAVTTEDVIDTPDVTLLKDISNFKPSNVDLEVKNSYSSTREQQYPSFTYQNKRNMAEESNEADQREVETSNGEYRLEPEVEVPNEEYRLEPEVEERNEEYRQEPKVESPNAEYSQEQEVESPNAEYRQEPEVEVPNAEYRQEPEVEVPNAEYRQEPEVEVPNAEYSQEPEVEAPNAEYSQEPEVEVPNEAYRQTQEVESPNAEYEQEPEVESQHEEYRQEQEVKPAPASTDPQEIKAAEESVGYLHQEKTKEETKRSELSEKRTVPNREREAITQPSAQTIPFNVLMLPQDRMDKQRKAAGEENEKLTYQFPPIQMLNIPPRQEEESTDWLNEQGEILESTLQNFNVSAKVIHVTKGPSVTRFEIQPAPGVKVSKITSLTDDIKLCLAAKDIRMEAPIPGKHAIGIEVPNMKSDPVFLREILRRGEFQKGSALTVALGLDISGHPIVTNLAKMPHGLVAGATGSGKSVCINSILVSLLYKATPDQVKLLLVDPKMVELAPYNELPHLVTPVITDAKQATAALKWVVAEMERRYELFSQQGVRDIGRYNDLYSEEPAKPALPYIVVVIDELADLMMVSPQDVEEAICRIAQKARACGIHLLLATQRPSVDVITGLIKANIPTRIAFSVSSQVDSRTIIDMNGAERLLGKGDMLFHENGTAKPVRVQGTFVSDEEIERVIEFVKKQRKPHYLIENEHLNKVQEIEGQEDDLFEEACYFAIEQDGASASSLQRRFRVGYNRAARLIDMMEAKGIVSEAMGSKPRNILMSVTEFEENVLSSSTD
ncbi:DNA translocase FtsK [Alkalihalobacterium chitinilyticum]|uniref:DNA translocase FtsK n=1 Tax=Alkalihalobacterium chitinilyticum TaxID=2980103 RepID=UPI0027E453FC|nr:DNA translocase FtsK [Alkalihalobacterium chitinilyticum]